MSSSPGRQAAGRRAGRGPGLLARPEGGERGLSGGWRRPERGHRARLHLSDWPGVECIPGIKAMAEAATFGNCNKRMWPSTFSRGVHHRFACFLLKLLMFPTPWL